MQYDSGSLAHKYEALTPKRESALSKAREYSEFSLPFLMPPEGSDDSTEFAQPFSSLVARGVNNLASKLMLTLFPTNASFFKLTPDEIELNQAEALKKGAATQIRESLALIERTVSADFEVSGYRPELYQALRLLVATGNACAWFRDDGTLTVHDLSEYVARWDSAGHLLCVVVKEEVAKEAVSPAVLKAVKASRTAKGQPLNGELCLYSGFERQKGGKFEGWQEVEGIKVSGTEVYVDSEDEVPMRPHRFHRVKKHQYGHGRVEEFFGDIKSSESLSQSTVEGAAAAARVLWMVNPTGYTRARDLETADNGQYVDGNRADVEALQLDKFADFQFVQAANHDLKTAIGLAFLLNSALPRDAERVTAEEIRFVAQELEDTLGGAYPVLAQELQLPMVRIKMARMTRKKRIPPLPPSVSIRVVTGVEALGRGHELSRLNAMFLTLKSVGLTEQTVAQFMHTAELIRRVALASGVEAQGLVKTDSELAQDAQTAQQNALVDKVAAPVVNQGGQILKDRMAASLQGQQGVQQQ